MQCAICNIEIGLARAEHFGPEFAHSACVIAYKKGRIDGVETEREACALVCEEQYYEPECPERAKYCADAIRRRINVMI